MYFFQLTVLVTRKGLRADVSALPELYKELGPWYQQRPVVPIWLRRVQMNLGESLLVLGSPNYWLMILSFIWRSLTGTGSAVKRYWGVAPAS